MIGFLKHYRFDLAFTVLIGLLVGVFLGWSMIFPFLVLVVLEVSLSFDNALVNATVLGRMSGFWQNMFMTVGLLIAVVGMRLLFPIVIVVVAAKMGFSDVVLMALHQPELYAQKLDEATVLIATFGGIYLFLIWLNFALDERELTWLTWIERPLAKIGKLESAKYAVALGFLVWAATTFARDHQVSVFLAGVSSILLYWVVSAIADVFEDEDEEESGVVNVRTGLGAFFLFLYLEVQDAAFSFDGVTGAFAITSVALLIAAGNGVGSLFVRSITVHLVKTGKIGEYRYLEHGAYWAIGTLSVCLLLRIAGIDVPEFVSGGSSVVLIGAAFIQSVVANRRDRAAEGVSAEAVPVSV